MMSLLVNGTGPLILLITHAIDEHKSRLSYMTLLGKNMSEKTLLQKICASRESNRDFQRDSLGKINGLKYWALHHLGGEIYDER